jgi:hypothetical protein
MRKLKVAFTGPELDYLLEQSEFGIALTSKETLIDFESLCELGTHLIAQRDRLTSPLPQPSQPSPVQARP